MLADMATQIPSAQQIRDRLRGLSHAEVSALASKTGAPYTTLLKIRGAVTTNPRLETVRAIWPELSKTADKAAA